MRVDKPVKVYWKVIKNIICSVCTVGGITIFSPICMTDERHDGFVLTDNMVKALKQKLAMNRSENG